MFAFFDNARVDWKRRSYLMKILGSTIQAQDSQKFKHPEMVISPLFNFLDQRSILSWLDVRSVFLTTGARYSLRVEIYLGIFILIDFAFGIFFCINLIIHEKNPGNDGLQALLFIYILILTWNLFHTLFKGSSINV